MGPVTWDIESIEHLDREDREGPDGLNRIVVRLVAWYETELGNRKPQSRLSLQLWLPWAPTLTLEQIETQAYADAREALPHFAAAIPPPHP